MQIWQDLTQFPKSNGEWQIQKSGRILDCGEQKVRNLATNWFLTQKKFVSTPESDRFMPSICTPELSSITHKLFLKKFRLLIYLTWFYFLTVTTIALLSDDSRVYIRVFAFLALVLLVVVSEYRLAFRVYQDIVERCLYFHWITRRKNRALVFSIAAFSSAGIAQFVYLIFHDDMESLIVGYGAYFPAIEEGQVWRYFTGPFIHSGLIHWFTNTFLLLFLSKQIGRLGNRLLIIVLFLSIPLSAIAAHLLPASANAFVGTSGAVFFLFGWIIGISQKEKAFFPKNYAISFSVFAVATFLLPAFFNYNTSHIAHFSGFLFGIATGWFRVGSNIEKYKTL